MKIYQVIEDSGYYEDAHEEVLATYLHKIDAEKRLIEEKAKHKEAAKCAECIYNAGTENFSCKNYKKGKIGNWCINIADDYDYIDTYVREFEVIE